MQWKSPTGGWKLLGAVACQQNGIVERWHTTRIIPLMRRQVKPDRRSHPLPVMPEQIPAELKVFISGCVWRYTWDEDRQKLDEALRSNRHTGK